jgi:hypothetical protein
MEEILASIRKIISEDSSDPPQAPVPAEPTPPPEAEVLELTEEVHDAHEEPAPPPVTTPPPQPAAEPAPPPAPKPADDVVFEPIEECAVTSEADAPVHPSEGIFSDKTRKALSDAFSGIGSEADHEPAAPAAPVAPVGGLPLEAVFERAVREAFEPVLRQWLADNAEGIVDRMKPAISEWLDEHFPPMLEEAVRNEVARAAKPRSR